MEGSESTVREAAAHRRHPPAVVRRRWLAFVACFAAILAGVPVARPLRQWIAGHLGDQFVLWLTVAVGAAAIAWTLPKVLRTVDRPRQKLKWWLLVPAALWLGARGVGHAEWFHLVEYSALSVLAFRALSPHLRDAGVYLAAAGLTSVAGIVDEVVQWYIPGRVWDLRDVALNVFVASMIQILLWRGVSPADVAAGLGRRSLRVASRLWMAFAALVLLCLFNTPEAVSSYAGKVPFTRHLSLKSPYYRMTGGVETALSRRWAQGLTMALLALLLLVHRRTRPQTAAPSDDEP